MPRKPGQIGSILASVLLAGLTVSVFAVSQNRGPVSAITRYHEAIARKDGEMLEASLLQPPDHPACQALTQYVSRLQQLNPSVRFVNEEKRGRQGQIVALYTAPTGRPLAFIPFSLVKVGGAWRVDAVATVSILRQM
ncbi:MAG: hypothetical protein IT207_05075 [Fimbriimonadaceae bacterium]|nr:hypothetical protein [Fimbriimonadaceae bacterium]